MVLSHPRLAIWCSRHGTPKGEAVPEVEANTGHQGHGADSGRHSTWVQQRLKQEGYFIP